MTNLVFQIITLLVTNVSESTNERYEQYPAPCPEKMPGCCVLHGWIQGPKIADADRKSVTSTCHRITNAVCNLDPKVPGFIKSVELGRELLWITTESFALVKTWASQGLVTNPPPVAAVYSTNWGGILVVSNLNTLIVKTNVGLFREPTNRFTLELR